MSIFHLIVFLVIVGIILQLFPIDARIKQILVIIVLLLCLFWFFGSWGSMSSPRFWR